MPRQNEKQDVSQGQSPSPSGGYTIYIRFSSEKDLDRIDRASAILRIFHGSIPVHFFYEKERKNLLVPEKLFASSDLYLKEILERYFGKENVVYKQV